MSSIPRFAVPPPGLELRTQAAADALLEARWRARIRLNIAARRRLRTWFAVVAP